MLQLSAPLHAPVQLSRQRVLHCATLVHVAVQRGKIPHDTSQLAPPTHAQSDPLQLHVSPAQVGDALDPHAAAMTRAKLPKSSARRNMRGTLPRRVLC